MTKHFKYLSYVLRHKWFVLIECWKVGLYWRGLKHDWHKFLPSEWGPYANFFYGNSKEEEVPGRSKEGYKKPADTGNAAFDRAWLKHQHRADHHWQWWILGEDEGKAKCLPMDRDAWLEMMCDWAGASRAQGYGGWKSIPAWYAKNRDKMTMHPETRENVDLFVAALKSPIVRRM